MPTPYDSLKFYKVTCEVAVLLPPNWEGPQGADPKDSISFGVQETLDYGAANFMNSVNGRVVAVDELTDPAQRDEVVRQFQEANRLPK